MPGGGARWWMTPPPRCRSFSSSSSSLASELSFWPCTSEAESRVAPSLMDWQFVLKRFPWGVWTSGQCQPVRPPPTWRHPTFCCPSWLRWRGPRRWGLWRVQSPDNDTQFSLGDPPGPSFLHFCSYPKIWWWVCITLESCQENGLWMSYF